MSLIGWVRGHVADGSNGRGRERAVENGAKGETIADGEQERGRSKQGINSPRARHAGARALARVQAWRGQLGGGWARLHAAYTGSDTAAAALVTSVPASKLSTAARLAGCPDGLPPLYCASVMLLAQQTSRA